MVLQKQCELREATSYFYPVLINMFYTFVNSASFTRHFADKDDEIKNLIIAGIRRMF